jgi:hypothetical protein
MRFARVSLVAVLLLAVPACMSNNKGKIVGKWLVTGGSAGQTIPPGAQMIIEFKADGRFIWTASMNGMSETILSGDYSLGMGDNVTWKNLNQEVDGHRASLEKIKITGDTMTISDRAGSLTLKRM